MIVLRIVLSFCLPSIEYAVFYSLRPNYFNIGKISFVANILSGNPTFNFVLNLKLSFGLIHIRSGAYITDVVLFVVNFCWLLYCILYGKFYKFFICNHIFDLDKIRKRFIM